MLTRKPLRAVLFDWDGTLLDSFHADANAYVRNVSVARHPLDTRKAFCGITRPTGITCIGPCNCRLRAGPKRIGFGGTFTVRNALCFNPALGRSCRRWPIDSGSAWSAAAAACGCARKFMRFGLGSFFEVSVFGDEAPRRKPHPLQLQIAVGKLGLDPACCIYVGDAPEDVRMARRAGVPVVGVVDHSPTPDGLRESRPDALIKTISSLPGLLWRC